MLLATLSTFCGSFGFFNTKLIQRTYPNVFHVVQFLFLRCFTLFFLTLIHSKLTGQRINKLSEIPHKGWFFMRTNANFFGIACITMLLWYLSASTAIMIQNIHTIIVMILSHFVFHEKIYFRYIIGIIMCFSGSSIIVLNEKKVNKENDKSLNYVSYYDTFIGLTFAFVDIFLFLLLKFQIKF